MCTRYDLWPRWLSDLLNYGVGVDIYVWPIHGVFQERLEARLSDTVGNCSLSVAVTWGWIQKSRVCSGVGMCVHVCVLVCVCGFVYVCICMCMWDSTHVCVCVFGLVWECIWMWMDVMSVSVCECVSVYPG